jgi:hypothetical protein
MNQRLPMVIFMPKSCRPSKSWAFGFVPFSPLGKGFLTGAANEALV